MVGFEHVHLFSHAVPVKCSLNAHAKRHKCLTSIACPLFQAFIEPFDRRTESESGNAWLITSLSNSSDFQPSETKQKQRQLYCTSPPLRYTPHTIKVICKYTLSPTSTTSTPKQQQHRHKDNSRKMYINTSFPTSFPRALHIAPTISPYAPLTPPFSSSHSVPYTVS